MDVHRIEFYQVGWWGRACAMAALLLVVIVVLREVLIRLLGESPGGCVRP